MLPAKEQFANLFFKWAMIFPDRLQEEHQLFLDEP